MVVPPRVGRLHFYIIISFLQKYKKFLAFMMIKIGPWLCSTYKDPLCLSTHPFPLSWCIYIYYAQLRPHIILFLLCHCLSKEICNLIIHVGIFQLYFFLFNLLPDENTINLYVPCKNEPYVYIQP